MNGYRANTGTSIDLSKRIANDCPAIVRGDDADAGLKHLPIHFILVLVILQGTLLGQ